MKYEIIDQVSRFVTRFGMIMDPETMNKARDEAGEYDFREISEGHYAVIHGKKMYIIITRDGEIGCSCDAMTFNRMDGSACKHIIEFTRRMSPVTKKIDEDDATYLMHVCGWTGEELHPEIELGGPGAVVQENPTPAPDEPEPKIYTQRCKHCDEVFSGRDLDAIKKELADHVKVCGMNPRAKPYKQEPDPKDKDPAPERKKYPDDHERTCQYCGMSAARKYQNVADAWLKKHEASCPKNPDVGATFSSDKIIPEDVSNKPLDDIGNPDLSERPGNRIKDWDYSEANPPIKESEEETKMDETTTNTQTEVQTTEPQRGFLTAAVSLDDAIKAFDLYGQAKTRLLNDNDVLYIGASGKPVHKDVEDSVPYIKKSGWRKMARFFGLSVDILGKEKIWTEDSKGDKYYIWAYQIKVSHQCGAYVLAEGVCSSRDKFFTKGGKVSADETNVMLKAQTVGINRGISDLLGAGEVSAEEVE